MSLEKHYFVVGFPWFALFFWGGQEVKNGCNGTRDAAMTWLANQSTSQGGGRVTLERKLELQHRRFCQLLLCTRLACPCDFPFPFFVAHGWFV